MYCLMSFGERNSILLIYKILFVYFKAVILLIFMTSFPILKDFVISCMINIKDQPDKKKLAISMEGSVYIEVFADIEDHLIIYYKY